MEIWFALGNRLVYNNLHCVTTSKSGIFNIIGIYNYGSSRGLVWIELK